jgi:hypothetical protein
MSAERGPIRILAVDDHAFLRKGIAGLVAGANPRAGSKVCESCVRIYF